MHNWQENEIKELLIIRASEAVRNQITGTVKDSAVYNRMTKLLAEKGVFRSHMQVISKLKALRKQYSKYHQQKTRCGGDLIDWPFYELCHRAFANAPVGNPVRRHRSPTSSPPPPNTATTLPLATSPSPPPPLPPPAPPPPNASREEHPEVVVSLWDEVDNRDMNKHPGPVDEEEHYSPTEHLHTINTNNVAFKPESGLWSSEAYTVPTKKKKTTVMEQVSTLVSATVAQLREMDAAMQVQEDARLQRLMDHEREMQNNLMSQLIAMHERISRENHERHLELVDRVLSRFPSQSGPSDH
ncbi:formin-1-like [Acanthochromis polyacanthus]|uniref:formin-1-like n=1 Tax=Acanthochromis polyacanthus TaxID=80966 RepID=UPI000B8F96A9|nr:formin-1-like [Acanthochromis polyacanthus]